ncbi:nucleopolyhedrovirus P10 family protein [Streptomyces sp. ISL-22]|uniref:nucleopolyhedrovirus P10 family protein n=1 Tax=unclassified Streptomyces TaxID=2593676 RepID=UPI001BEB3FA1|nr:MULTISPECIES: nucleopolyhedrovirus P10 family protein [unclassified Streptomyces]MBT2418439.1 nucleopolyhedrovirus P10 family protein [Streptomyces sp. ISL-24]MBT2434702.1 nucleopolyhedrovirus P10 family protein [Streptomyces sp. ISL-22]
MTTADRWTQAVRQQLGLGRLLPLGGARDGSWISERAAEVVLRRAAAGVRGVRLGALRIGLTDPKDVHEAAVPLPPSALPPGPLRVTADFAATAAEPLPATAERLRALLAAAATERLGLTVTEVDLRVTALLDEEAEAPAVQPPEPTRSAEPATPDEERIAAVTLAIPGVTRMTGTLGGLGRSVHIEERQDEAALPRRHVRLEIAVSADHRAVEVAREVRERVGRALADHPTVAVLVTSVG